MDAIKYVRELEFGNLNPPLTVPEIKDDLRTEEGVTSTVKGTEALYRFPDGSFLTMWYGLSRETVLDMLMDTYIDALVNKNSDVLYALTNPVEWKDSQGVVIYINGCVQIYVIPHK